MGVQVLWTLHDPVVTPAYAGLKHLRLRAECLKNGTTCKRKRRHRRKHNRSFLILSGGVSGFALKRSPWGAASARRFGVLGPWRAEPEALGGELRAKSVGLGSSFTGFALKRTPWVLATVASR